VDFAGRLDFATEDALRTFWKFTANNASYIQMTKDWIQSAYRMQYIVNSCAYPAPGVCVHYVHHAQPPVDPIPASKRTLQNAQPSWS
jgi:hypothetical protein